MLGLVCTAGAFVIFSGLIAEIGPGRALVITYVDAGRRRRARRRVLGERPGAGAIAGLLLILAGSWLSTDGRLPPGPSAAVAAILAPPSPPGAPGAGLRDPAVSRAARRSGSRRATTTMPTNAGTIGF